MKIAITGGFGFIGAKLANAFSEDGHDIILLDKADQAPKGRQLPENARILQCDITNPDSMKSTKVEADILIHCAAQPSVAKSFEIPRVDMDINIAGTFNILEWCHDNNIPRIIYASSFNVYDEVEQSEPYDEDMACIPNSLYALSKYTAENYLRVYGERLGLKWNVIRMFNVYGPGQDPANPFLGMVSIFMNMVKSSNLIEVKGSLQRYRDFVYIEDVIQGWKACAYNDTQFNKVFNIGSGVKTTVEELLDDIIVAYDKQGSVKVKELAGTPGDFMGCYADISAARNLLNYQPKYSLRQGLVEFRHWLETQS